jgi:DNA-binding transcriptional MerR regulator
VAKSPDAFRTISEVADFLGLEAHVLRFWETKFAQVKPVKRAGGRRYYRPSDMALLAGIRRLLHDEGMTIRGVQKVLREKGVAHVAGMAPELKVDDAAAPVRAAPARRSVATGGADAAKATPPAPGLLGEDDSPTLPFDLPARPIPARAASSPAAAPLPGHDGPARVADAGLPEVLLARAARLDPATAADVLSRARALVVRLRNTPE